MAICGCGKPTTHKGMCPARWAVRKANKEKEAPVALRPMTEEAIARRLFGDLADDVLLLRKHGHAVARFHADYRVDREVLRYDQVQARADALRKGKTDSRATRVVDGSEVAVESHARTKKPRTEKPETVVGLAGEADAPAPIPQKVADRTGRELSNNPIDLRARIRDLEQRVEFLFTVVAEAITGRRTCILEQAAGLEQLEATLRQSA